MRNWRTHLLSALTFGLALGTVAPARATLCLYEPFDYGAAGNIVGKGGNQLGFVSSEPWALTGGTGSNLAANLTFGSGSYQLRAAGGSAWFRHTSTGSGNNLYRGIQTNWTGTAYGSYVFTPDTSVGAVAATVLGISASGSDSLGAFQFGAGAEAEGYNGRQRAAILGGYSPDVAANRAMGIGTNYLILFKVTNVGGSSGSSVIKQWMLTDAQFANLKPGGLTESELDAGALGDASTGVFARSIYTNSSRPVITSSEYLDLRLYLASGSSVARRIDEIRMSNASTDAGLDEVTPLQMAIDNTGGASNVTPSSATLCGSLISTNSGPQPDVYCYWGRTDAGANLPGWENTNYVGAGSVGAVTTQVASLMDDTTYYYRYYVTNSVGEGWAPTTATFKTLKNASAPTIANVGFANLQTTTADMVGNLTQGQLPATAICYWGTNDGGAVAANWMTNDQQAVLSYRPVTNSVAGLVGGRAYCFRYCATNGVGTSWASSSTWASTLGAPDVDNAPGPTNVSADAAQMQGTLLGGNPTPDVRIYWGTSDGGSSTGAWRSGYLPITAPGLASFTTNVAGLLANQKYWYRVYATNSYGERWAPDSTNFTTGLPALTITNAGVLEGAAGTTTAAAFRVMLSVASAGAVTVDYATANGTATTNNNDYQPAAGTLTIPPGTVSTQLFVAVNGDSTLEPDETFVVNLGNVSGATLGNMQATGTISNDDTCLYVRSAGGSDTNGGGSWHDALATLSNALSRVPLTVPIVIHVQASSDGAAYAPCSRTHGGVLNVEFQGGWEDVDGTPLQTGLSVIRDPWTNNPGIKLAAGSGNGLQKNMVVNRFVMRDVTRGVELSASQNSSSGITLAVSNTTVAATADGIYLSYPQTFGHGPCRLTAENVTIAAGLGGAGDGLHIEGKYSGSVVRATAGRVSTITSSGGCGVRFSAVGYSESDPDVAQGVVFSNTVFYSCSSNGIYLDAAMPFWSGVNSNRVMAVLGHCTIADNAGDGLHMVSRKPGSYGNAADCIFSANGGHGINLDNPANAFTCADSRNVFFGDDILTNGTAQAPAASSSVSDPLFNAHTPKPDPWYKVGSSTSPAYRSAGDGGHRGAYQDDALLIRGTAVLFR
jgi:hypothetical protein